MNILICVPDKAVAKQLENIIKSSFLRQNEAADILSFTNSVEAAGCRTIFDIAVIHTDFPDINGIVLGKVLTEKNRYIKLIFISPGYKLIDEAFNLHAVRFLKTPLNKKRFAEGIEEAIKQINEKTVSFSLKENEVFFRIEKDKIIYIEIENRRTKIVTEEKTFYSLLPMVYWREHLHGDNFFSPHKSFIVNMDYITEYKRNCFAVLLGKHQIPIARAKGPAFHRQYIAFDTSAQ